MSCWTRLCSASLHMWTNNWHSEMLYNQLSICLVYASNQAMTIYVLNSDLEILIDKWMLCPFIEHILQVMHLSNVIHQLGISCSPNKDFPFTWIGLSFNPLLETIGLMIWSSKSCMFAQTLKHSTRYWVIE